VDAAKIDQGQQTIDLKAQQMDITAQQNQDKIDLQLREQALSEQQQQIENGLAATKAEQERLTAMIEGFKALTEGAGIQAVVGPHVVEAVVNQAVGITEVQEEQVSTEIGQAVASTDAVVVERVEIEDDEPSELDDTP